MKKFLNLFLTLMVMGAAISMTSCSKDDNNDPITNEDPVPQIEVFKFYTACVNAELLTYYDVKLTLDNGEKTKEVTLTPDLCKKGSTLLTQLLTYTATEIDGVRGVNAIKATVTPNENIERMFAENKSPEIYFCADGKICEGYYVIATGSYYTPEPNFNISGFPTKSFLEEQNGKKNYELFADQIARCLMGK